MLSLFRRLRHYADAPLMLDAMLMLIIFYMPIIIY